MSESRKVGPWFCVGPIHVRLVDGKWEVYSGAVPHPAEGTSEEVTAQGAGEERKEGE